MWKPGGKTRIRRHARAATLLREPRIHNATVRKESVRCAPSRSLERIDVGSSKSSKGPQEMLNSVLQLCVSCHHIIQQPKKEISSALQLASGTAPRPPLHTWEALGWRNQPCLLQPVAHYLLSYKLTPKSILLSGGPLDYGAGKMSDTHDAWGCPGMDWIPIIFFFKKQKHNLLPICVMHQQAVKTTPPTSSCNWVLQEPNAIAPGEQWSS